MGIMLHNVLLKAKKYAEDNNLLLCVSDGTIITAGLAEDIEIYENCLQFNKGSIEIINTGEIGGVPKTYEVIKYYKVINMDYIVYLDFCKQF